MPSLRNSANDFRTISLSLRQAVNDFLYTAGEKTQSLLA
jgi:hypothetical protein